MDGLDAALEQARSRYDWERGLVVDQLATSQYRNRLRKVSPRRMVSGKATEMLEELDWWGISRPRDIAEAERAKSYLLGELEQRAGAPGEAGLREAGFTLLSWWCEQGNRVTATKLDTSQGVAGEFGAGDVDGNSFAPSDAVAFLAEQLPQIVSQLTETGVGMFLDKMGFRKIENARPRGYALPPLSDARAVWDDRMFRFGWDGARAWNLDGARSGHGDDAPF